jgi:hypothetical protein
VRDKRPGPVTDHPKRLLAVAVVWSLQRGSEGGISLEAQRVFSGEPMRPTLTSLSRPTRGACCRCYTPLIKVREESHPAQGSHSLSQTNNNSCRAVVLYTPLTEVREESHPVLYPSRVYPSLLGGLRAELFYLSQALGPRAAGSCSATVALVWSILVGMRIGQARGTSKGPSSTCERALTPPPPPLL